MMQLYQHYFNIYFKSIECSKFICERIKDEHDKNEFEQYTTQLLNKYFMDKTRVDVDANINEIIFTESYMSDLQVLNEIEADPTEWIIGSIALVIFLLIIWTIN